MKQGDVVLVWGASGGIGGYAVQYVLNGGGIPVGVVSSPDKVELLHDMGVEHVIDRKAEGYKFWKDEHTQDEGEWRRLRQADPRHWSARTRTSCSSTPAAQTFGASVFVAARGRHGRHVRGHQRLHDRVRQPPPLDEAEAHRRQPLRQLQGGVGGQPAHRNSARSSRSCRRCIPLDQVGEAAYQVHHNLHEGKIGVLCLAPDEGLGIDDPELRAKVGEDKITLFRAARMR